VVFVLKYGYGFIEDSIVKIYNHDDALSDVLENLLSTKSWVENGLYSWGKTPKHYSLRLLLNLKILI